MSYQIKMNWVLQIEPPSELKKGVSYEFEKEGNRIFPLDTPIDLINKDREAIAKIKIEQFTNKQGITTGNYSVIKIYSSEEKKVLTQYWEENQ